MTDVNSSRIEALVHEYLKIWWETPCSFPRLGEQPGAETQAFRERDCDEILDSVFAGMRRIKPDDPVFAESFGPDMKRQIERAGRDVAGFSDKDMELLFDGGFLRAASDFSEKAREFQPGIVMSDVVQAIRNVWIMNCIQLLKGLEVKLTPSAFSYSMLYPYTDNVLDGNHINTDEKKKICDTLRLLLEGKGVGIGTADTYAKGLKRLVEGVESQYPRDSHPKVYQSLLYIHDAQVESLLQQNGSTSPYEADILGISFSKGGTSVLADAYLVMGDLTREEEDFIFGFGIFLQLADDLQDTITDMKNGHMTIFSQTAGKWHLDDITSRLFNFYLKVIEKSRCFNSPRSKQLTGIMEGSFRLLIFHAVADNCRMYSADYVRKLERYSPLSFKYIRGLDKRVRGEYGKLMRKSRDKSVDSQILSAFAQCSVSESQIS